MGRSGCRPSVQLMADESRGETGLSKSEQMARVRSKDTGPELKLRRELWSRGLRYRVHFDMPGTPDIAFPGQELAVFVDGCFWHGCEECYTAPERNAGFWRFKLERNQARDRKVDEELREEGWRVLRIWEHQVVGNLDAAADAVEQAVEDQRRLQLGRSGRSVGVRSSEVRIGNPTGV